MHFRVYRFHKLSNWCQIYVKCRIGIEEWPFAVTGILVQPYLYKCNWRNTYRLIGNCWGVHVFWPCLALFIERYWWRLWRGIYFQWLKLPSCLQGQTVKNLSKRSDHSSSKKKTTSFRWNCEYCSIFVVNVMTIFCILLEMNVASPWNFNFQQISTNSNFHTKWKINQSVSYSFLLQQMHVSFHAWIFSFHSSFRT